MSGRVFALLLLVVACAAGAAGAATDDDRVTLNFVNVDVESMVKLVSEITGRNFVVDQRVKGTVSIVTSNPVPRAQVYPIFLSALRVQGFSAVEAPAGTRIVPEAEAKFSAGFVERDGRVTGDRIVTMVFPLQYEAAAQLLPVLRPLIAPNNTISVLAGSNTLVITDYAENLRRLARIITAVDRSESGDVVTIQLKHASPLDIAQILARLVTDGAAAAAPGAGGPRLLIAPDPRSNSLLLRSTNPAEIARLRDLVATLDVPARAPGNVHVVYLRNAEAAKIAETLRALVAADAKPATTAPGQPAGGQRHELHSGRCGHQLADHCRTRGHL